MDKTVSATGLVDARPSLGGLEDESARLCSIAPFWPRVKSWSVFVRKRVQRGMDWLEIVSTGFIGLFLPVSGLKGGLASVTLWP